MARIGVLLAAVGAALVVAHAAVAAQGTGPVVRLADGLIAGSYSGNLEVYQGIPFAAPPVGELRWRPPTPVVPWRGTLATQSFARSCMQSPHAGMNIATQETGEDCLYLNVWAPRQRTAEALPVIVWIHGGGFSYGSTAMPIFDGASLADKGVVFVSTAYRLGPFGFLAHPALSRESRHAASGNYGLLDMIQALRWVRENIAQFGGNPRKITIMGESAGGMAVNMLVESPLAAGLFRAAIAESGAAVGPVTPGPRPDMPVYGIRIAEIEGKAFSDGLGIATATQLRALSAAEVLNATRPGRASFALQNSWPVDDGWVLKGASGSLFRRHQYNDTPILIGYNADEGALFGPQLLDQTYLDGLRSSFGESADTIEASFPGAFQVGSSPVMSRNLLRDVVFGWPIREWGELQARFGKGAVYEYFFSVNPPPREGVPPGPIHGAELPYAFNNLAQRNLKWTDSDRRIAAMMSSYWTNFAKNLDPNGPGLPPWPASNAHDRLMLEILDEGAKAMPFVADSGLRALNVFFDQIGRDHSPAATSRTNASARPH